MLKIGLLGFGTVGRALAELIAERGDLGLAASSGPGLDMELRHILRRSGKAAGPLMTESFDEIVNDPEVDCVVDALSGIEPSHEYMRQALLAGKSVVTANKAALAAHYAELTGLAREKGAALLFEASCGGGMPWVENLKKAARVDRIQSMQGILNGTGNFILDHMDRFGMEFDAALKEAQALGYAEADPTADVGGFDIANKAVISASVACGMPFEAEFPVVGLQGVSKEFLDHLKAEGRTLRHMMLFRRSHDRIALGVAPVVIPSDSLEAQVRSNFNCATLVGDVVGRLTFFGQGAGGRPTADAVLQDLSSIASGRVEPLPQLPASELLNDASLLTGTVWTLAEKRAGMTLEDAVRLAQETNEFLAFEPED